MQKSVLIEIIGSLTRKEIRGIRKWLNSPAHNQRQDVLALFEYLIKVLDHDDDSRLEKEVAWGNVFPDKPYDDAFMRQVMYFLLKAVEEYLVFEDYSNNPVEYQLTLTRIYRNRNLDKAYKQAHRLAGDHLEKQPMRNSYYLQRRFNLEEEEYNRVYGISQIGHLPLQELSNALERWFVAEKFRISLMMLSHKQVYQKAQYNLGLTEQLIQYTENLLNPSDPATSAYFYAFMAITHSGETKYYDQLENLIFSQRHAFDSSENRSLFIAALNYCIPKLNQGDSIFARRAFELYRMGVGSGDLLENNMLSRYTFGNAVGTALKIKEFQWAENFIQDFQGFLEEKQRNSIVNFNLSRVFFEKGDYNRAQTLLLEFDEYDHMLLNIIAKTMLLKIYYEKGEFDAFESLLESLRIYLQRKEALDATRKTAYKNLISLMRKLLHLNPFSKTQVERLRTLVETTQPLMERDWLLRQLTNLRR